jgi:hypothetical protein
VIASHSATTDVLFWGFVLIGGIALLGGMVWLVRRWAFSAPESGDRQGWSLQHLRDMKADGQLSDEEFETLKARLIREYEQETKRKDGASADAAADK